MVADIVERIGIEHMDKFVSVAHWSLNGDADR